MRLTRPEWIRERPPSGLVEWTLPLLAVGLALATRLWQIDLGRFVIDEVNFHRAALAMLDTRNFLPPPNLRFSVGIRLPPLFLYILAAFASVNRDPAWMESCAAAVDAIGTLFVYFAAKEVADSRFAGFAAGLLYATSPAAIVYVRMILNTEFLPFFAGLCIFGLVDFWRHGRSIPLALALLSIGWLSQLHLVTVPFAALWLAVAIMRWRDVRWLPLVISACFIVLPLAPYVYAEAISGWPDLSQLVRFLHTPATFNFESARVAGSLAGPALFRNWYFDVQGDGAYDPLTWLLIGLIAAGIAVAIRLRSSGGLVLGAWLALPVVLLLRHNIDIAPNYLLTILPVFAILEGLALGALWTKVPQLGQRLRKAGWQRVLRGVGAGLLGVVACLQLRAYAGFLERTASDPRHADYLAPLRYSAQAAHLVDSIAKGQAFADASSQTEQQVVPYLARAPGPWRWIGPRMLVFPASMRWLVTSHDALAQTYLAKRFGPVASVRSTTGQPEFQLFDLAAAEREYVSDPSVRSIGGDFGHMIAMEAYRAPSLVAGQTSPIELAWRITDATKMRSVQLGEFAHLVDGTGRTWSNDADQGELTNEWQSGDLVISPFDMNIPDDAPTGGYWLETGFYKEPSREPVPLFLDGRIAGVVLRIGPLRVFGRQPTVRPPIATFGNDDIGLLRASWQGRDVTLDWLGIKKPKASYTVFVHVLDQAGHVVSQDDSPPQAGAFPTTLWEAGDVVRDVHRLPFARQAGQRLDLGLYTKPDLHRLPVSTANAVPNGDHLVMAPPAN